MNVLQNFKPISGANDDNLLVLSGGTGRQYVNRRLLVDNMSSPNRLTLSVFNSATLVVSHITDGVESDLFSVSKSDFPKSMRDADECGVEFLEIIKIKMFGYAVFSDIYYEQDKDNYSNILNFKHDTSLVVKFGDLWDYVAYDDGNIKSARTIRDLANSASETTYNLTIQGTNGLRAVSQKVGDESVMFNLRHIVGGTIKEPIELSLALTEVSDTAIREIGINTTVLLMPNHPSLRYNTNYQDIQWLSDREGVVTRHRKGQPIILTAVSVGGFDNTSLKIEYFDASDNLIDWEYQGVMDTYHEVKMQKYVTLSINDYDYFGEQCKYIALTIVESGGEDRPLSSTIRIELTDYCSLSETPNLVYLNERGGLDNFNLFNEKTNHKKADNGVSYQGLFKHERHTARKSYSPSTELKSILLSKAEYDMAVSVANSVLVEVDKREVITARQDGSWSDTDTAKSFTITLDELL